MELQRKFKRIVGNGFDASLFVFYQYRRGVFFFYLFLTTCNAIERNELETIRNVNLFSTALHCFLISQTSSIYKVIQLSNTCNWNQQQNIKHVCKHAAIDENLWYFYGFFFEYIEYRIVKTTRIMKRKTLFCASEMRNYVKQRMKYQKN